MNTRVKWPGGDKRLCGCTVRPSRLLYDFPLVASGLKMDIVVLRLSPISLRQPASATATAATAAAASSRSHLVHIFAPRLLSSHVEASQRRGAMRARQGVEVTPFYLPGIFSAASVSIFSSRKCSCAWIGKVTPGRWWRR
ncbi:hypothetical protein E2C01_028231 [Portunus trituberculatus]|uniref:Uncharacterized protein n=1 Tax=Portunus trituberculatus TaxID=210409 RepID=A0A5B7ENC5_PORTR|nr:hypothetical protein [Portunus trituberculatus]